MSEEIKEPYIEIFVSDWLKEYWFFYAYISLNKYEQHIDYINKRISKENYRDGDVYVELINHHGEIDGLYNYVYHSFDLSHQEILNPKIWELFVEKGNDFFKYFEKFVGSNYLEDLENSEIITFSDWYEVLETYNPDLYEVLEKCYGLSAFDITHFYNCQGFHEIDDLIVLVVN